MRRLNIIIIVVYISAFYVLPVSAAVVAIKNVSHVYPVKVAGIQNSASIRFNIAQAAVIQLDIYDGRDYLVHSLRTNLLSAGDNTVTWDAKTVNGKVVPDGHYHYTLTAISGNDRSIYDITDLTGGYIEALNHLVLDSDTGIIHYTVPRPSLINIRAGVSNGGPLLSTLVNWHPRKRGEYTMRWDGKDANDVNDLRKISGLQVSASAYILSDNTIVVGDSTGPVDYLPVNSDDLVERTPTKVKHAGRLGLGIGSFSSKADFSVQIELPDALTIENSTGVVLRSKGKVPVRITVPQEQMSQLNKQRFEPVLYVDGVYQSEIESGFLPLTWKLDTSSLPAGNHYIAVNLRGFDGEYGAAVKFFTTEK